MYHRPFSSTNTNVLDETTLCAAPRNVFGQNMLVSQEAHRKICDTLTTSYTRLPTNQACIPNPQAVTFTFGANCNPLHQLQAQQLPTAYSSCCNQPCCCDNQVYSQLNQLQQANAMELIRLQRQFQQHPFQLKFHVDHETTTNDLPLITKCSADLNHLLLSKWPYWLETSRNHINPRKLVLKQPFTPHVQGNVYDEDFACRSKGITCNPCIDQHCQFDTKSTNKQVQFNEDSTKNQEVQAHVCCDCCECNCTCGNEDDTKGGESEVSEDVMEKEDAAEENVLEQVPDKKSKRKSRRGKSRLNCFAQSSSAEELYN